MNQYSSLTKKSTFSLISKAFSSNKLELEDCVPYSPHTDINTIRVAKSVHLIEPIFKLKYSSIHPHLLASCGQNGSVQIVNADKEAKRTLNSDNEILPDFSQKIHDNSIFGLDWCFNDTRILTAGADWLVKMTNLNSDNLGTNELVFFGHQNGIKWLSQSPFNDHLCASCGRDRVIFIWDVRAKNERYCNNECRLLSNHIHPIGSFSHHPKRTLKYENTIQNTFTSVDFLTEEQILSTETNNDNISFWDLRMKEEYNPIKKDCKRQQKKKLRNESVIPSLHPYTYMESLFCQWRNEGSLHDNSIGNSYFKDIKLMIDSRNTQIERNDINGTLDYFVHSNFATPSMNTPLHSVNSKSMKEDQQDMNNNLAKRAQNQSDTTNKLITLKEIATKKPLKGITSLNINRSHRKILVSSISNKQVVYDALFMDKHQPYELKGHETKRYYVKSVLSHCGQYVLSGSSSPCLYIWDLNMNKDTHLNSTPVQLAKFHQYEVNAVDWSRNRTNCIASACDGGLILIWDH